MKLPETAVIVLIGSNPMIYPSFSPYNAPMRVPNPTSEGSIQVREPSHEFRRPGRPRIEVQHTDTEASDTDTNDKYGGGRSD